MTETTRDVARMLSPEPTRPLRFLKATVTALDPFTIQLPDGEPVENPTRMRSCLAGVGDTVEVRKQGSELLVIDAVDALGPPLVKVGDPEVTYSLPDVSNVVAAFEASDVALDSHGWAVPASDRVTPTIEGWYLVTAQAQSVDVLSVGERFIFNVRVSGSARAGFDIAAGGTTPGVATTTPDGSVAEVLYLNGTSDYVDVAMFQNTGAALDVEWSMSVLLVRPEHIT
ncbi:MAG: hypothetical protein AAGA99_21055 [Actinomycetota bacterium]